MLRINRYLPPLRDATASETLTGPSDNLPVGSSDRVRVSSSRGRMPRLRHATNTPAPTPPIPEATSDEPPAAPRLPRGVPAVTSHPGRIRAVTLTERIVSLTPSIDNLVNELRAANLYIRPSGQLGHAAKTNPHPTNTATMTTYGLITSAGFFVPGIPANFYNTNYLDGTSTTVNFSETLNGWAQGLSLQIYDGFCTAIYSVTEQFGSFLFNGGAQLQVWRDKFRLGPAFVNTFLSTNYFLAYGGFVQISPSASITDLGPYLGPDPEGLARAHGINHIADGLRRAEIIRGRNLTGSIRAGGGDFNIAILGRLDATRGKKTVFRTMTSTAQTHDLLFEGSGLRQYFKDRFRALGWKKDIVDIPKQHRPYNFKLGDEVVVTKTGSLVLDLLVGNLSIWAGIQVLFRGDMEVSVHRLDEHRMEVVFNPTKLRDKALYIFSPFGPAIDIGRGKARSYRQGYIFDLREPQGLEAYHLAIDGKLPTQKQKFTPLDATYSYTGDLAEAIAAENAHLPRGVERIFVHLIVTAETQAGGGTHWGVVPLDFLPHGWTNTLFYRRIRAHEKQTITDGKAVDYANSRNVEYRSELLMYGVDSNEISAQQRWRTEPGLPQAFNGLTLEATLVRSCVRRLRNNKNVIGPLNKAFDLHLHTFRRPGLKQRREVDLSREMDADGLAQLARFYALWDAQRPLPAQARINMQLKLDQVARATGIGLRHFRTMFKRMHDAPDLKESIVPVQEFVQQHGIEGFAAIHRLVPETADRPLSLDSICSTYIDALTGVERAQLRYPQPISDKDSLKDVRRRLERYERALAKIDLAVADLDDDPLISTAERPLIRAHLEEARGKVFRLRDIDASARGPMAERISGAFWYKGARFSRYQAFLAGDDSWRVDAISQEKRCGDNPTGALASH